MLQCASGHCIEKCERASICGDGYACDEHGYCVAATKHAGEPCASETECATGLSCQISDTLIEQDQLNSTCARETGTRPEGAACDTADDCRNGTCALGQCVSLCIGDRDCASGRTCVDIPHVLLSDTTYRACLPEKGAVIWPIPMSSPSGEVLLPVPTRARSLELVMSVNDPGQKVGAERVFVQSEGDDIYSLPCAMRLDDPSCVSAGLSDYFMGRVRHMPAFGQSVLLIPSRPTISIGPTVYRVTVSSFRPDNTPGSAIPHVTALVQLSSGSVLDLHFYFLDLADHPCAAMTDNAALDATTAQGATYFQTDYLEPLRQIFRDAGIFLGRLTYENIGNQPKLDSLDITDAGELFALGGHSTGINVFFVRSLSPMGLQAFGPNPGPAGIAGTRESGIVIGLDTLCYRNWSNLARLTAHEIARYMGLYHNVELENPDVWRDLIDDDDANPTDNLMYFSEFGGWALSKGQSDILTRSPVLQ